MKSIQTILAASLVATLAACGSSTPPAPAPITPAGDTSAPSIVSVVPANAATGVQNDANIVITFSEAMNKLATQSAYQSASGGILPAQVQFTWNTEGTILTIDPNSNLSYNGGSDPAAVNAREYAYQVTTVATDLAGNALSPAANSFKTLRRITQNLPALASLSGDVRADGLTNICNAGRPCAGDSGTAANAQYKGFVSFNMTDIPAGVHSFEFANLNMNQVVVSGVPYAALGGTLLLDHISFATMNLASAFNGTSLGAIGTLSSDATLGYKTLSVLTAVQDDYAQRIARGNRTQYRLAFPTISNFNGIFDAARFETPTAALDPSLLTVRYLVP